MGKKRLFIVAGTYTTAISAALIKQLNTPKCDNYLVSVGPTLVENVDAPIKDEAKLLGVFEDIFFFFDFCLPKSQFKEEVAHILSFDFQKFKEATGNIDFDEIYTVYIHGAASHLVNLYPNADLYFMEDGTAAYLKMINASRLNARAKKIYTLNYFNKIKPYAATHEGVKLATIDRNIVKGVFEELAATVSCDFDKSKKSIIFCAQNISINPMTMEYENELYFYVKNIKKLLDNGYVVYFKEHPKSPNMFFKKLKKKLASPNLLSLNEMNVLPVEVLIPLIKPNAIVSMFSSALLSSPWIFNVPAFSFYAGKGAIKNDIFDITYLMVASYIPPVDMITKNPEQTAENFDAYNKKALPLDKETIYMIKVIDHFKLFISKRNFKQLQKNFKSANKTLLKYANLKEEVIDLFLNQSYFDFLLYYAEYYQQQYKIYLEEQRGVKKSVISLLIFIKNGFSILFKILI